MKRPSQRAQRVGDQIQRELAGLLHDAVKDPRVGTVTVTGVDVSADLSHANVRFTNLAGSEHAGEAMAALAHTAGFLRSELARRLDLYSVPQLHFVYDDTIESAMRLSQLIDTAIAADRKLESGAEPGSGRATESDRTPRSKR
ncbi:MAG TPA: 30S ribosome-binding factor RbfA [Casimicrobiaceae bacterium]